MRNYFDVSKIKTFDVSDLSGRTLKVKKLHDRDEGVILIIAFDLNSGESFLIKYEQLPIAELG